MANMPGLNEVGNLKFVHPEPQPACGKTFCWWQLMFTGN